MTEEPWANAYRHYMAELERRLMAAAQRGYDLAVSPPQYYIGAGGWGYGFTVQCMELDPFTLSTPGGLGPGWVIYRVSAPEAQAMALSLTPTQPRSSAP